jgi:hypothetical protein
MKRSTKVYLSVALGAAAVGGAITLTAEQLPVALNAAIERAVSARVQQQQQPDHRVIRVGAGGG